MKHLQTTPTQSINAKGRLITFEKPLIMGILNVTPDSFFDGGKHNDTDNALRKAEQLIRDGVDIIDIGAYSSRPGAPVIDSKEELKRYTIEVHAIKSSSASIGAYTLSEKAKILEDASRNGDILTIQNNHNDFIKQYNLILDDIKKNLEKIKFENDIKNKETNCDQIMDKDLFYKYIDEIKTAIDNFESDLAIELLNKIKDVKLDKDNKIIIEETLELINMFNYDEALECISKLNKDILNTNFE